jgi:NADPH:quinone reductase
MRAVVMRQFGAPDVLHVEQVPTPKPDDGDVIVKVHAVSVNRTLDVLVRRDGNNRNIKLPAVLGVDPYGVVVAIGRGVRERRVGDRVGTVNLRCGSCRYCLAGAEEDCRSDTHVGMSRWGGYAEYVSVMMM